ncbi:hypothetical protein ACWPN4_22745 [Gordonia polyisoprenivorans]
MASTRGSDDAPGLQEFTIHSLNNYSNIAFTSLIDRFDLQCDQVQTMLRHDHKLLVAQLKAKSIDYGQLSNALVPKAGRHEVAFVFDSMRSERASYGYDFAQSWVPVLRQYGSDKSALRAGDVAGLPDRFLWQEFAHRLVGPGIWPRLPASCYFIVYMTNLSAAQRTNIAAALLNASGGYLGYVDCSTWSPLKAGLYLPQVGLRLHDDIICDMDLDGDVNLFGYPYEASGFRVIGIDESLYGPFLTHRLDNGIPEWADVDSSVALSLLGGKLQPATTTRVVIDERRITYLNREHHNSLRTAGLSDLNINALADAIKAKLTNGIIYNLRFRLGTRNDQPAPELDAMMYSVQVEFPDDGGLVRRYQVGMKYTAETHTSEMVTFY